MADFKVAFLGTSSAAPTKDSCVASTALTFAGETLLVDAGENCQQQMMRCHVSILKVKHVVISHWHGDHFFGLPGLLQTMSLLGRKEKLTVWAPLEGKTFLKPLKQLIEPATLRFEVEFKALKPGLLYAKDNFNVEAVKLRHSIPSFGVVVTQNKGRKFNKAKALALGVPEGPLFSQLQQGKTVTLPNKKKVKPSQVLEGLERVKKIAVLPDTSVVMSLAKAKLKGCDLLVHEVTFAEDSKERAKETLHSFTTAVARLARAAGAKQLIGTHVSARYEKRQVLEDEMRKAFPNARIAGDLDVVEV